MRALIALVGAIGATACTPGPLVPAPSIESVELGAHAALAEDDGVRLTAHSLDWRGAPPDLGLHVTPVLVTVDNWNTGRAVRVAPDDFAIVSSGKVFYALAPASIAEPGSDVEALALPSRPLPPGDSVTGYVYFEHVTAYWGQLDLRFFVTDAPSGALVGSVDVPMIQEPLPRCTLASVDTRGLERGSYFDTCLLPH